MKSTRYKPIERAPIKLVGDYWVPNNHPLDKKPQVLTIANQGIKQYAEALRALGAPQDAHTRGAVMYHPQDDATTSPQEVIK